MIRLILLLSLTSCAALPPAPDGDLCSFSSEDVTADCIDLRATLDGKPSMGLTLLRDQLSNFVMMSPETWAHIQTYIVQLRSRYLSK